MNTDQAKGAVKIVAGKVQAQAGKLTGDREMQAKGLTTQITGKAQKNVGAAKGAIKDAGNKR